MLCLGVILLGVAAVAVGQALYSRRHWHTLLGTETSTYADLRAYFDGAASLGAAGDVARTCEVVGLAQAGAHGPLTAQLSGVPCVWFHTEVRRRYRDSGSTETETVSDYRSVDVFPVVDHTGTVYVHPLGADVDHAEKVVDRFVPERFEGAVAGAVAAVASLVDVGTVGYEHREWVLRPGTRLYVHGAATDLGTQVLVGAPDDGPFVVSTRSERQLTAGARRTQRLSMVGALIAGVLGVAALVLGLVR